MDWLTILEAFINIMMILLSTAMLYIVLHIPVWIFRYKKKLLKDVLDDDSKSRDEKINKLLLFDFFFRR